MAPWNVMRKTSLDYYYPLSIGLHIKRVVVCLLSLMLIALASQNVKLYVSSAEAKQITLEALHVQQMPRPPGAPFTNMA